MAIGKENYFWHKLHSLTGIIPIGFYMIQHLTLNSFSLAGPDQFNAVIGFFQAVPKHVLLVLEKHVLLVLEIFVLGLPILFHAIYGLFITSRSLPNVSDKAYRWRENWMYTAQRISGIVLFLLLILHVATTTVASKFQGEEVIQYAHWQEKLTQNGYIVLIIYAVGIVIASYHLCYGLWNFCIRWGITVSGKSQRTMQQVSAGAFVVVTLLGWSALYGFLRHPVATPLPEAQVRQSGIELASER